MSDGVRLLGSSLTLLCLGRLVPFPDLPVSTCPHAHLPTRRLRLRAHIGLQSQGFFPIRGPGRAGRGGELRLDNFTVIGPFINH